MLLPLEDFFKAHQYTVAALGVLGTFSAVVVSLTTSFVGVRATRTRIKARASINVIVHSTLQGLEKPKYLVVSIRNVGVMPAAIPMSHFSWKLPFARGYFTVLPLDYSQTDEWVPQKKYPVEIKPRSSEVFFLSDINMFREYARKDLIGNSVRSRFWFRFIRAYVLTDDGKVFKVTVDSSLKKEFQSLKEASWDPAPK